MNYKGISQYLYRLKKKNPREEQTKRKRKKGCRFQGKEEVLLRIYWKKKEKKERRGGEEPTRSYIHLHV